ncbi:MAG: homoaconitate hydratase family protein [Chloroflexi bacterium]|nr:homoaconitate hydratase family protein [Chloroflexota bacterium]
MPMTFAQKSLARAAGLSTVQPGQIVDARPDVALSHDNTAAIARIFRTLGRARVRHPERLAITLDHAVPAPSTQHATNHAEVRQFVREQGIVHFYEAGRGICHQVLGEEAVILPGQLLVGADSHSTHLGWLGAFAAGIGRSEMAAVWATGELWLRLPESIRFDLVGSLRPGVTSKDLGLWLLAGLGQAGGAYRALEFGGPGLRGLSLSSRMVISNLMAEAGAKNAYLEPDDAVFAWLARRLAARTGRTTADCRAEITKNALYPDAGAAYLARIEVDLGRIEPVVACPHSPDNVQPLSAVAGTRIDQAFLGTCTNGRLEDLAAAAAVLRDQQGRVRRVAPGTRLIVIPASSKVLQAALAAGYIDTFVQAGAMIGTPGCGPCMGNHFGVPAAGEVVISTGNRNFRGRMGTVESEVYLASPAVVAASALAGHITQPAQIVSDRLSAAGHQAQTAPRFYSIPIRPIPCSRARTSPPRTGHGPAPSGIAWKYGDNINTDVIFAGKYTYSLPDPADWAAHALEDLDPTFAPAVQPGDVIVAGENWGCGSSREQAVIALKLAGVRAIVAKSFARIYFRNCVNQGVLPIVCPAAVDAIEAGDPIAIDPEHTLVHTPHGTFSFPALSPSLHAILSAGGLLPALQLSANPRHHGRGGEPTDEVPGESRIRR